MRKLFTTFLFVSVLPIVILAQTSAFSYKVTNPLTGQGNVLSTQLDTMYVALQCRASSYQAICSREAGVLSAVGLTASSYASQDSVTWMIEKGAALGTTPRVRIRNLRTGEYLHIGLKGGTSQVAYVAPINDPYNGTKDLLLKDQGTDSKGSYHYFIKNGTYQLRNRTAGSIDVHSSESDGWKLVPRPGPQPKAASLPSPTIELSSSQTLFTVGGTAALDIKVTKQTSDLLGVVLLYNGTTLVDTIQVDANGVGSYTYNNLSKGNVTFVAVYSGCTNYSPNDVSASYNVVADPSAKNTTLQIDAPSTALTHNETTLNFNVKTNTNDIVNTGEILVYINNTLKDILHVDSLGNSRLVLPNLLDGTVSFKAIYLGDEHYFLNSDTARTSISVSSVTPTIKPYPVYYDLNDAPEIAEREWKRARSNADLMATRGYFYAIPADSISSIQLGGGGTADLQKITYSIINSSTAPSIDNTYNRGNNIQINLGLNRPTWLKIKTPWLNPGSYNVYLSYRVNSGSDKLPLDTVTLDGKSLYFPSYEMNSRTFVYNGETKAKRRWNSTNHSTLMSMNYLGSVKIDNIGTHELRIVVKPNVALTTVTPFDMLQFIPVDQDSVKISEAATVSMAKTYLPLFDIRGFANLTTGSKNTTITDALRPALSYQVTDPTDWGTLYSHTIDSVGIKSFLSIKNEEITANYVTVYRAEDRWTRISEGYANGENYQYTCNLPAGKYYYETILYSEDSDGSQGLRVLVNSGTFSVGPGTGTTNTNSNRVKVYAANNKLSVIGIKAGASVVVTDITGRVVVNEKVKSDTYSKQLPKGLYVVKVVSGETVRTKVLVK